MWSLSSAGFVAIGLCKFENVYRHHRVHKQVHYKKYYSGSSFFFKLINIFRVIFNSSLYYNLKFLLTIFF